MEAQPDKVNIGFVLDDGRVHMVSMTPTRARQMGRNLFDEADLVEGEKPIRVRLRRRWKSGGERDRANFLTGIGVGWLGVTVSTGAGFQSTSATIATVVLASMTIVLQCQRHFQDRSDFKEAREKDDGSLSATTGQLPWEVIR